MMSCFTALRAKVTFFSFLPLSISFHSVCSPVASPIPYGKSNFGSIRRKKMWYVDKTRFLHEVEASPEQLLLVRPPRFGKSLFLSMMEYYYDLNHKDDFDDLFSGLWIHQNLTSLRSSFHVLKLDLSSIPNHGDALKNLTKCINGNVVHCCRTYGLNVESIVDEENASQSLLRLAQKFVGQNFMILSDEYDRFANELMFQNPTAFGKVVTGKSSNADSSFFKSFFQILKKNTTSC